MGRDFVGEINKKKILKILMKDYPNEKGKTSSELKKELELQGDKMHRDTIYNHCRELINDGDIVKPNKRGRYFITEKVFNFPEFHASYFGNNAIKSIRKDINRISTSNKFCNTTYNKKILEHKLQIDNEKEYYKLQLFEFSNRIGALITYILLQSLNPNKIYSNLELEGKHKNEIIRSWCKNAVDIHLLLEEFEKLDIINQGLTNYWPEKFVEKNGRIKINRIKIDEKLSMHDLEEKQFKKIISFYKEIYPHIFDSFEKIKNTTI